MLLPFPKRQSLDYSKLKEFADDNFKSDENGKMFSKRVENTLRKGEIARYSSVSPPDEDDGYTFRKRCFRYPSFLLIIVHWTSMRSYDIM